jgi:hypothetical protein
MMKTVLEKNSLGSWFGWEVEHHKDIPNQDLMDTVMSFYETCKQGNTKVNLSQEGEPQVTSAPF